MICKNCGMNNDDNARFCTNCGTDLSIPAANEPVYEQPVQEAPVYEQPVYAQPAYQAPVQEAAPKQSGAGKALAIVGMILGILSLVLFCVPYLGFPCGLAAIILAAIAKGKGCRSGMATAGLVTGIIGTIICFIFLIIFCASGAAFEVFDALDSGYYYY